MRTKPPRIIISTVLFALLATLCPASYAEAITYQDFQFKLSEVKRQQAQAAEEYTEVAGKLEDMKTNGTPIDQRKAYSIELIELIKYMEKLNKDLAELKKLLPQIKVRPVLKLTGILPNGAPGMHSIQRRSGLAEPKSIKSIQVSQFPLEIIPDKIFTVGGHIIWREYFQGKKSCYQKPRDMTGRGHPLLNILAGPRSGKVEGNSMREQASASLMVSYRGLDQLVRYCTDAPTATDPESGNVLQAEFEKELRMKYTIRFIPQGQDKLDDGTIVFRYKIEPDITGKRIDARLSGNLLRSSPYTSGSGFCLSHSSSECGIFTIYLGGIGAASGVVLAYEQVKPGDPYIRSAPRYSHPSGLNSPPLIGDISYATTVPLLVGLTEEQAKSKLKESKLKWNLEQFVTAPSPNSVGKVKATRPGEGQEIQLGATVSLTMYSGSIKVPNVLGMRSKQAKETLERAGFTNSVTPGQAATSKNLVGKVATQNPKPDHLVAAESEVALTLWGPMPSPEERCNKDLPGTVPSGEQDAQGRDVCICPQGTQWNQGQRACMNVPRLNDSQVCARDFNHSVPSGKRGANGGPVCVCPQGMQWNRGKTACINVPRLNDSQVCARDFNRSVPSGRRGANGGPVCVCPQGMQWNGARTFCVTAPQLTDFDLCARDFARSMPSGQRGANGGPVCTCMQGWQWNSNRTACVQAPQSTDAQICRQNYGGSVPSGQRAANGGPICVCRRGMQWGPDRTACIQAPRITDGQICFRDLPGSVPSGQRGANGGPVCVCPQGMQWGAGRKFCVAAPIGGGGDGTGGGGGVSEAERTRRCADIQQQMAANPLAKSALMGLAQSLQCKSVGDGRTGTGSGARPGCFYVDGLLGQPAGTFDAEWESQKCTCNGKSAPLSACGR